MMKIKKFHPMSMNLIPGFNIYIYLMLHCSLIFPNLINLLSANLRVFYSLALFHFIRGFLIILIKKKKNFIIYYSNITISLIFRI